MNPSLENSVRISTDFDNGWLAAWRQTEPGVFDCWPYEPQAYEYFTSPDIGIPRVGGSVHNFGDACLSPPRPSGTPPRRGSGQERIPSREGRRDAVGAGWVAAEKGSSEGKVDEACFCFHFRVDGCLGKKLTFRFHIREYNGKAGECASFVYANPDFPVFSYDNDAWFRMEHKKLLFNHDPKGGKIIVVEQTFESDSVYLAYQYPYTNDRLKRYVELRRASPFFNVEAAGRSTQGREILLLTITDSAITMKKKTAWLIGLQHCAELGAGWGLEGLADFLLSADPLAAEARRKFVFKIIPIVNVDSVAEGRGRLHPMNMNLNREWELEARLMEAVTVRKTMDAWIEQGNTMDIFVDVHGFASARCRNWWFLPVPATIYAEERRTDYNRFVEAFSSHFQSRVTVNESRGYAAGGAARKYGAFALTIDAWVYSHSSLEERPADLACHYQQGKKIFQLEEIKASGAELARAIMDVEK